MEIEETLRIIKFNEPIKFQLMQTDELRSGSKNI